MWAEGSSALLQSQVVPCPSVVILSLTFGILNFSKTAKWKLMPHCRKEVPNILYQDSIFWGWSENQDDCPGLWLAETGSKILSSSTKFVLFGPIKKQRWAPWHLIGENPRIEFNKTWQEASSQHSLLNLCFSDWSEYQDGHPGLWLAETFISSPLQQLNRIQQNLMGSKVSMSCT